MASKQHDELIGSLSGDVDAADPIPVVREKMHAIHPNAASPGTPAEAASPDGPEAPARRREDAAWRRWGEAIGASTLILLASRMRSKSTARCASTLAPLSE